jgi:hypothetical protein
MSSVPWVKRVFVGSACIALLSTAQAAVADNRPSVSKKGSLLVFPNVEVRWFSNQVVQDTFLSVTNDFNGDVFVHFLFVNGDDPIPAVRVGNPPVVVERAHDGWTKFNWTSEWTGNESNYFSVMTGLPKGAPRFDGLDTGPGGPGRPDNEGTQDRVLRGFVLAWAVDETGHQISWNHLQGTATVVNYRDMGAWEYGAYSFQTVSVTTEGSQVGTDPGKLELNGIDYDSCFNRLLLDFFADGSEPFSAPKNGPFVMVETDLTLLPMLQDLRQDNYGPLHTKALFEVWNSNEDFLSHTDHCLWCWDQILLGDIAQPNNFLLAQLHTDKGKARIDGVASSTVCDAPNCCDRYDDACRSDFEFENNGLRAPLCSEATPLLGVANKILAFSGQRSARGYAGVTLTGQGYEDGKIKSDLPSGPEQATEPTTGQATRIDGFGGVQPVQPAKSTRGASGR